MSLDLPTRICMLDSSGHLRERVKYLLEAAEHPYEVKIYARITEAWVELAARQVDAVVVCVPSEDKNLTVLDALVSHHEALPAILALEKYEQNQVQKLINRGAIDCVNLLEITPAGLQRSLENAIERHRLRDQVALQNRQLLAQQRLTVLLELVDSVSYETTQLLTSLLGYIEILQTKNKNLDPALDRNLDMIAKSGKRLADVLGKILSAPTLSNSQQPLPQIQSDDNHVETLEDFIQSTIDDGHLYITIKGAKFNRELGLLIVAHIEKIQKPLSAVTIELSKVEYMDSLGIDGLLRAWRITMKQQIPFAITGVHGSVKDTLTACHLDELLNISGTNSI